MAAEQVTISIDEAQRDRFSDIVRGCERAGLRVEQRLEGIGVIVGAIDAGKRAELEQVPGVAFVEGARHIQLPPPDSERQ